jgi:hypothetical protein
MHVVNPSILADLSTTSLDLRVGDGALIQMQANRGPTLPQLEPAV